MSVASQRPNSATSTEVHRGEGQNRETQFLSVNRAPVRGGLTSNTLGHQPTNSLSGSSQNDSSYSTVSQNQPTVGISVEQNNHDGNNNPETASGAPSSGGSSENDPWIRKNLLTLDGGGIRGYSSLLILRAVMMEIALLEQEEPRAPNSVHPLEARSRGPVRVARTRTARAADRSAATGPDSTVFGPARSSHYFPAHYFDYIAGTSTGGLIAIMLGRLVMTVDECLEAYETLADRVFGHPRILYIRNSLYPKDKYNEKMLEAVIQDIVRQRDPRGSSNAAFPQYNEDMCRTMVLAWQKRHFTRERVAYLLRSYRHPKASGDRVMERNPDRSDNYPIHQVGRATSAAPFYFKAVNLDKDDPDLELIDGGFGANNPSEEAYREVSQMCNDNPKAVKVLLSIGTGRNLEPDPNPGTSWKLYLLYGNAAAKWATQSQGTHRTMEYFTKNVTDYYRLNVKDGLGKMKLDEWKGDRGQKTMDYIRSKTRAYLQLPGVKRKINALARQLVDVRRARSSLPHRDRWERFCHGVEYACCVESCHRGRERFRERQDLHRHVELEHRGEYDTRMLETLLDGGKRFPLHDVYPQEQTSDGESDSR